MRPYAVRGAVVLVLAAAAWWLPDVRRALIFDITWWDAPPADPPQLPAGTGPGLGKTPRTRVVLIDGLSADLTPSLPSWRATCKRGLSLLVDVGFPTVSLPVEVVVWTGLTQQQTGIVDRAGGRGGKYGHPLDPPLDQRGIPVQIPGSIAVAEDHGWIVRSLGFSKALPSVGETPVDDHDPEGWKAGWEWAARYAIGTTASLVFVHILRVDSAGHRFGIGAHYGRIAVDADRILGGLIAVDPTARWFLLSDHGHLGGHGGEERTVRQVEACIAGPGVAAGHAPLVHMVDIARAIADSTGATLDPASRGRPLAAAIASPLAEDQAVPPIVLSRGVIAIFLLAAGLGLSVWSVRRWWLAPWWFAVALGSLLIVNGEPTLSLGWLYGPSGRPMIETWLPALAVSFVVTWLALGRTTIWRALASQLALPVASLAACVTAAGAWPTLFGAEQAPVVPRYTAWMTVLVLMVANAAAAVGLAVLARLVRSMFARPEPAAPPRSGSVSDV